MAEYLLVETLPYIEARGGLFYIQIEGKDLALTPHMFLATVQHATNAYRQWFDKQREALPPRRIEYDITGHG